MKPFSKIWSVLILLCFSQAVFASISIHLSPLPATLTVGETYTLPVYVKGFEEVRALQFALKYNDNKVKFLDFEHFDPTNLFGFNNPLTTTVNFAGTWIDSVTKPDSFVIVEIRFEALATEPGEIRFDMGSESPVIPKPQLAIKNYGLLGVLISSDGQFISACSNAVAILIGKDTVAPNAEFCLPITVKNFTNVTNYEMGFTYDSTLLRFNRFDTVPNALGIPSLNLNFFHDSIKHRIRSIWADYPVTLPDGASIFKVCFQAIGPANSFAELHFMDFGLFLVNRLGVLNEPVPVNMRDGFVRILSTSTRAEEFTKQVVSVYPNPSDEFLYIQGETPQHIALYDMSGKQLMYKKNAQKVDISHLHSGMYSLVLTYEEAVVSKMVFKK